MAGDNMNYSMQFIDKNFVVPLPNFFFLSFDNLFNGMLRTAGFKSE